MSNKYVVRAWLVTVLVMLVVVVPITLGTWALTSMPTEALIHTFGLTVVSALIALPVIKLTLYLADKLIHEEVER